MNEKDYSGAVLVLESFLEGAMADLEEKQVENDWLIESVINALKRLNTADWVTYKKRFEKAKQN